MVPLVGGSVVNAATGDHDPHAQGASRRFQQVAHPEDGTALGHTPFFSPRSVAERAAKHQSSVTKA